MTHDQARKLRWLAFFAGAAVLIPFIRADEDQVPGGGLQRLPVPGPVGHQGDNAPGPMIPAQGRDLDG